MQASRKNALPVPAPGTGMLGVGGHIGYLLRQAHAAHRIRMEKALLETGMTLPQFSVLTMLAAYRGASSGALARLSLLTPQTMSVIISNLEKGGHISRRPHAVHGRIQEIEITETGMTVLARCKKVVAPVETTLLVGVSPEEEAVLRAWLVKIADVAD